MIRPIICLSLMLFVIVNAQPEIPGASSPGETPLTTTSTTTTTTNTASTSTTTTTTTTSTTTTTTTTTTTSTTTTTTTSTTTTTTTMITTTPTNNTHCETFANTNCSFPFVYKGVTYHGCTNRNSPFWAWCATSTDVNNGFKPLTWHFCMEDTCSVAPKRCETFCNTYCELPFEFRGVSYYGCTTELTSPLGWCATSKSSTGSIVSWHYCRDPNC